LFPGLCAQAGRWPFQALGPGSSPRAVLGEVLSDLRRTPGDLVRHQDHRGGRGGEVRIVIPAGFAIHAAVPVTVLGWAASVDLPAQAGALMPGHLSHSQPGWWI